MTQAVCELPLGHLENHRGEHKRMVVQWPQAPTRGELEVSLRGDPDAVIRALITGLPRQQLLELRGALDKALAEHQAQDLPAQQPTRLDIGL